MAKSMAELKKMSMDDLIAEHDKTAERTGVGLNYFLDEIHRREQERFAKRMERLTQVISLLTVVVTVATLYSIFK